MQMDRRKQKIACSFLIAIFLAAFEAVVVATAAPVIVQSLHNFTLMSWIFSAYLLTSAMSTPIYGKLADLYGRKRMLLIGITIFLVGSTLAGLAQSMEQLILFRAVQGLGSGAILTICFTMIGDIFTLEERSLVQGGISTMWGVAGLVGPLLGGFLIDYVSWHWIFFINVPFALICLYILGRYVHEQKPTKKPSVDYVGALLLSGAIALFLLAIMNSDVSLIQTVGLGAACLVLLVLFYRHEKNVAEPIIPLFILNRQMVIVNVITFGSSVMLIANTVYVTLYIQSILGYSATVAGISMAGTSLTWFFTSTYLARLMIHYRTNLLITGACLVLTVGSVLLWCLTPQTPLWYIWLTVLIFGIGFSGTLNTVMFIVQDAVAYDKRGAAVGLNMLTRTLAQTIGVAVFGTILNYFTKQYILQNGLTGITIQDYYDQTYPQLQAFLGDALFFGLQHVFLVLMGIALCCAIAGYFVAPYKKV